MTTTPPNQPSEWLRPQTIIALLGMLAAVTLTWMNLDKRVTQVEGRAQSNTEAIRDARTETREDIKDINEKLDRLIEKGK